MVSVALAVLLAVSSPAASGDAASPVPAATAVPATTAAPTAAAAPAAGPLREIVYNVAQSTNASGTASDYGGTDTGSSSGWDQGKLTIDVLQVFSGDILSVRASESWNSQGGRPYSAVGYVAPDGTLSIVSGTYSVAMTTVLPYIASGFVTAHDMTLGTNWSLTSDADKTHYEHHYAITKINGADVTISIDGKMTGAGIGMFPTTEQDTIVYRPARLVPISGDLTTRLRSSNGGADQTVTHNFHFERISDTKDP
jgi:hypothetical protein